jgi:hypothetical protein
VFLDGVDQRKDPTDFRARIGVLIEAPAVHSVADFYRVALITPLLFVLPAIAYFRNRDIVE